MIAIMLCSSCQTPWTLHRVVGGVAVHTCGGQQPAPGWTQTAGVDAILTEAEQAQMVAEVLALVEHDGRRTTAATTKRRYGRQVLSIPVPQDIAQVNLSQSREMAARMAL